jgi:hypothetical protein
MLCRWGGGLLGAGVLWSSRGYAQQRLWARHLDCAIQPGLLGPRLARHNELHGTNFRSTSSVVAQHEQRSFVGRVLWRG